MDGRIFTYIIGMTCVIIGVALAFKIATTNKSKAPWSFNKKIIWGVVAVASLGNGIYDLLHTASGRYGVGDDHWTKENQAKLVQKCFNEASTLSQKYPEVMHTYCECSIAKIAKKMTYREYIENMNKPQDEQLKNIVPFIQGCYDTMMMQVSPRSQAAPKGRSL
jgi:hypothetical protein